MRPDTIRCRSRSLEKGRSFEIRHQHKIIHRNLQSLRSMISTSLLPYMATHARHTIFKSLRTPSTLPLLLLHRKRYHFDTQALVSRLEEEGLSHKQAVGIMSALELVVQESVSSMVANLVTRAEQEKVDSAFDAFVAALDMPHIVSVHPKGSSFTSLPSIFAHVLSHKNRSTLQRYITSYA